MAETALAQLDDSLTGARIALEEVPVVDFRPFLSGTAADRKRVALEIGRACRDIGFFYTVNSGVPPQLVDRLFAEAKRFFTLPPERKAEIAIEKSKCHRGWFALGGENLDPAKQEAGDYKEGIKIGRDLLPDHPLVSAGLPLHGPNQWPSGLPGWKETMQEGYEALSRLGRELMHAFALALELPESHFDCWLTEPMATLGPPLHYPPQSGRITEARIGAGAHTDFGCLTILAQDPVGGLQVRNSAKKWIDAPFMPGSFVVNIGDMMERWTNGVFASTLHRVINSSGNDRYSLPFFFDPDLNADLTVLETCTGPGIPPKYPPTKGGQHLLDRINATFEYRWVGEKE